MGHARETIDSDPGRRPWVNDIIVKFRKFLKTIRERLRAHRNRAAAVVRRGPSLLPRAVIITTRADNDAAAAAAVLIIIIVYVII